MRIPNIRLGSIEVSRFVIGGNPFSGFSHQSRERSQEMLDWYSDERIVEVLFQAESLGLNVCLSRGDEHITRVLRRYWDEGGTLQWIAQTNSRAETSREGALYCIDHGAAACYLHGGVMDNYIAQGCYDEIVSFVDTVKAARIPVGIAGHMPEDWLWAEEHLALDFYMGCYYNPSPRQDVPHHDPAANEQYLAKDREERVAAIRNLTRPVIHYKILAAGRHDPAEAFAYATQHMRPQDAVCVGIYTRDKPNMLAEDLRLFLDGLRAVGQLDQAQA
ncbi:MAG: hypothetical protein JXA74_06305 [Anaerolineae bacterium]|nr:hypothetical protein [Anaerolineae bacterium]